MVTYPEVGAASKAAALLSACRPRQWVKNLLVVAAPGAAGALSSRHVLWEIGVAFVAFCLVSSGTYLLNDVNDRARDRLHPLKRARPVACGTVSPRLALATGAVLIGGGIAVASPLGVRLVAVLVAYLVVTGAYTLWLREVAVLDAVVIAAGFILRAVAGGAATGTSLSEWFLIVTSFSALFVVAGKRAAEIARAGPDGGTRSALAVYSEEYLRYLWTMSSTVAIGAYCIWAFSRPTRDEVPWMEVSIVPFVLGVMRYALLVVQKEGGAPELVLARDRPLQLIAAAWVGVFVLGAYAVG